MRSLSIFKINTVTAVTALYSRNSGRSESTLSKDVFRDESHLAFTTAFSFVQTIEVVIDFSLTRYTRVGAWYPWYSIRILYPSGRLNYEKGSILKTFSSALPPSNRTTSHPQTQQSS